MLYQGRTQGFLTILNTQLSEETIEKGLQNLQAENILEKGDTVVLAGGAKILPNAAENKAIGGIVRI